ncbi:MAG: hypothetical protein AAGE84_25335 [Cyanobacteria bacterium P01_G01_bin.39]
MSELIGDSISIRGASHFGRKTEEVEKKNGTQVKLKKDLSDKES